MEPKPLVRDTLLYMNIIGMNPENQTVFAKARGILTLVLGTVYVIFILLNVFINWKGIVTLFEGSDTLVAIGESVIKALFLQVYSKKIKKLLEFSQEFWCISKIAEEAKQKVEPIFTFVAKFRKGMKICYFCTTTMFLIKPIIFRTKVLPINIYQPFFFQISPCFEIVYFFECLTGILLVVALLAFDLLFIFLVTYTVCELKILQYEFSNFKINQDISKLIEHHNFILGLIKELKNMLSILMLTEFVASMFCICLGLFSLSSEGFPPSPTIAAKYIAFVFSYTGEMYFLCYAGNVLAEESTNVANSVYQSDWYTKNQPELRRAVILVILRAQEAEKLTVGGMFDLDLNCFNTVINKAFSIFTLMQAMQKKNSVLQ